MPQITKLWLEPPMAFARIGPSPQPLCAFEWGNNANGANESGKTRAVPALSLRFDRDGGIESYIDDAVIFRDSHGIRPVCPFFELHGEWIEEGELHSGPITPAVIEAGRLEWKVRFANLKAANLTEDHDCRIVADLELAGDDVEIHELDGRSPANAKQPLVPMGLSLPLGQIRLSLPNRDFPGFRLRFSPGRGLHFGPSDLPNRGDIVLPESQLILNPKASWCGWKMHEGRIRAYPPGQVASDDTGGSLGIIDQMGDGIIECRIRGSEVETACARIVVGPPDFAPDRRPIVSIADGLKDRTAREDTLKPLQDQDIAAVEEEIVDLFERISETAGLMNLDALVARFGSTNPDVARNTNDDYDPSQFFQSREPSASDPLPITSHGRKVHRRLQVREVLLDYIRRRPNFLKEWVRDPDSGRVVMTRQMPALMVDSDRTPLTLTRRQYQLLMRYAEFLQAAQKGEF
jgi:hypothetical protein